jgi:uracil-DNA glycosylase
VAGNHLPGANGTCCAKHVREFVGTQVRPDGPIPAKIMLVGEAPGAEEEARGIPFVGASGQELNRMLQEAGISRSEVFCTNVVRERPPNNDINHFIAKAKKDITPQHSLLQGRWVTAEVLSGYNLLQDEIRRVGPRVILALGNTPLWALTGLSGITKWRGSTLSHDSGAVVLPALHPAAILREWSARAICVSDFRRAARLRSAPLQKPQWNFITRPSYEQCIRTLDQLYVRANHSDPLSLSFDLETRHRHIACAGLAWSRVDAICIPFMCVERPEGYWDQDQESEIVYRLARLLKHPNVRVVGQNLLYDAQYTWRHWHFVPKVTQDTMIGFHSLFSDLPKSLAFQASMLCSYYVFWKEEGKGI